jgi:hypothetical protein
MIGLAEMSGNIARAATAQNSGRGTRERGSQSPQQDAGKFTSPVIVSKKKTGER